VKETLESIESEILTERGLQREQLEKQWKQPLAERVNAGRALGFLRIDSIDYTKKLIHFVPPVEDFAFLKEGQRVRISQNVPEEDCFIGEFQGLTDEGLTVYCKACDSLDFENKTGWTIDEDWIDISDFYLRALQSLAEEPHGREHVFPVLFEEQEASIDAEIYDEVYDELDEVEGRVTPNESQKDAVATALAASPMHLIQGPPGTGKTQTLASLVEKLVEKGHRVLVTGFTHRSIHQALGKIVKLLGDQCPVVKIGGVKTENLPFPCFDSLEKSGLDTHMGAYVIGATPFALYSKRLQSAHFDSAVIDETSQLNLPASIMVMMKSDRWFFFGDDKQLPPVSLVHQDDPALASVFSRLKKQTEYSTLDITYRMNEQLTRWPSENFYNGDLEPFFPKNELSLKSPPNQHREVFDPKQSLVSVKFSNEGSKSYNDDEADFTVALIEELLRCGLEPEEIGVIAPFRAQASRIRTLLRNVHVLSHSELNRSITVDTVDRFQGQEREVILYSFTASDTDFIRKIHRFFFNSSRLNVAVTRAKTKVILLYSQGLLDYAESYSGYSEDVRLFLSLIQNSHPITPLSDGEALS